MDVSKKGNDWTQINNHQIKKKTKNKQPCLTFGFLICGFMTSWERAGKKWNGTRHLDDF